jgi:spore coat polysaccharide biosynthesis protein SpsF
MGSTRLPGKVMLEVGGQYVVKHVLERLNRTNKINNVVLATSKKRADDIIEWVGKQANVTVFRGDEKDVLDRMYRAAKTIEADDVVRITADCPLLAPRVVDAVVTKRREQDADYASNILDRTFPRGLDAEAFTFDSYSRVHEQATRPSHLEHVTPYYLENPDEFDLVNVTSDQVFRDEQLQDRTDLRLTLDELDDYRLLRTVFDGLEYPSTPPFPDVVRYIDEHGLSSINDSVDQKSPRRASDN